MKPSHAAAIVAAVFFLSWNFSTGATESIEIPAGPFIMGDPGASATPRVLELPAFAIDRFEISNAEFAAAFPQHTYPPGANAHPATGISWEEARGYCERTGKRLPTEMEWEKAARGVDGRIYPWGDAAPRQKPQTAFSGLIKQRTGFNKIDVSPYGAHDMAGSVWEWTATAAAERIITRGGLWNFHLDYEHAKTFDANPARPDERFIFLGFRCAR